MILRVVFRLRKRDNEPTKIYGQGTMKANSAQKYFYFIHFSALSWVIFDFNLGQKEMLYSVLTPLAGMCSQINES